MLETGSAHSTRKLRHADVLVVGSGAGGALVSLALAEAGLDVVCLEQGPWVQPQDHPHASPDWQWQRQTNWNTEVNVRNDPADYPIDTSSEHTLMWNGVGGSTRPLHGDLAAPAAVRFSQRNGARAGAGLAAELRGTGAILPRQ